MTANTFVANAARSETPGKVPTYFSRMALAAELLKRTRPLPKADFSPGRACKSAQEIKYVRNGVRLAEQGLARAIDILRQAKIGQDGTLLWQGQFLMEEDLKGEIDAEIARHGGTASHTIAAHGQQAADPHQQGQGPIQAHTPILLDIFPRDDATGYFGRLTPPYKGQAPDIVSRAFTPSTKPSRRPGHAPAAHVRPSIKSPRRSMLPGFPTTPIGQAGRNGFFHSTGMGLGWLAVHEASVLVKRRATPL